MRSMTGYGTSEYSNEKIRVTVDLKAYNNKYLDISINMPIWLGTLEGKIRETVKEKGILRGRVDLNIRLKELLEDVSISIDKTMVKEVVLGLNGVIKEAGISDTIKLDNIMAFDGVVKSEKKRDINEIWELLKPQVESCLDQFVLEKEREGTLLEKDIFSSLDIILAEVETVETFIPKIEDKIKNNFKEKFTEVLGHTIDENRILSELGILLVKYDVNEEVVRLKSHIENFRQSSNEKPCGKKLDFICQEMNREINTIGSKSPIIEISQIVVNMKNHLEQIREQARNVE